MSRTPKAAATDGRNPWQVPVLILLGAGLFVAGLVGLEQYAKKEMRGGDRDLFPFADIKCGSPNALETSAFLGEVQYLASLPDQLHLLDEDLVNTLAAAFSRHPWVRMVDRVEKSPSPRQVQVFLTFRIPVLMVTIPPNEADRLGGLNRIERVSPGSSQREVVGRAVDAEGVLLPVSASVADLPLVRTEVPLPVGPAGTPWGDASVEAAAKTAGFLQTHQPRLGLTFFHVKPDGLWLESSEGSRVLWGHAPGAETAGEVASEEKLKRLLDYCDENGNLGTAQKPLEHDVRTSEMMSTKPINKESKN